MKTHLRSSILVVLAAAVTACGAPSSEPSPAAGAEPAPVVEPTYEPAYPDDVSGEGLSEADVAQQPTHDHGEGEHAHEEGGERAHEDDDEHED